METVHDDGQLTIYGIKKKKNSAEMDCNVANILTDHSNHSNRDLYR